MNYYALLYELVDDMVTRRVPFREEHLRLARESRSAIDSPDLLERWRAMGSEPPSVRTPAEFTAFVERERKPYADLVKRSGATVD